MMDSTRRRLANFNGGPAAIPLAVLEQAQRDVLDLDGSGLSILESSFRGERYLRIHHEASALLRELYGIPDDYEVLFMQGGASQQFALLPMNFAAPGQGADYVETGLFSQLALKEARTLIRARSAGSSEPTHFDRIPAAHEFDFDANAAYVHITENNTSEGTEFRALPDTGAVPLVADLSSNFFSRRIDVSRYGMIYAGAQKSLGPTGVVIVIVKRSWLAQARTDIPEVFRYTKFAEHDSLYNTPPTFAIYLVRSFLAWAKSVGGLAQLEAWNAMKASCCYEALDRHPGFYRTNAAGWQRSRMNAVFRLRSEALEQRFIEEAARAGMTGLGNHPAVGGLRISLYNGVPVADVQRLGQFLDDFARRHAAVPANTRQRYITRQAA